MEKKILWHEILEENLSNAHRHHAWLKTLSYLEFIGYRKMVKSLNYHDVNNGVFHHLTDEIQHSFMLREIAEKNFKESPLSAAETEECIRMAEDYFQTLDRFLHEEVQKFTGKTNSYLAYLWVSYIIEKRAMQVYPHYYSLLKDTSLKMVLQKIVQDESHHLSYLENVIRHLNVKEKFEAREVFEEEERLFDHLTKTFRAYFASESLEKACG